MKKKLLSVLLTTAMLTTVLAGCGGSSNAPAADNSTNAAADTSTDTAADTSTDAAADTAADTAAESDAGSGEAVTLTWSIWDESTTQYW